MLLLLRNKRKHSSSTSSSPVRTHKRKHHSSKSERKKHKEHKSREEKSSHKHKRKKHHKEQLQDLPNQVDTPDVELEFKAPHTRSAVMVVKKQTDPKVSLLAPDLESPILPACVQNFCEPPSESSAADVTFSNQGIVGDDVTKSEMCRSKILSNMTNSVTTDAIPTMKNNTSSESLEDDGIEEGEILEGTSTHMPTGNVELNDPPQRDSSKVVRKLKRKVSQSIELATEKSSNQKLKKRKWKKEKDIIGEKTKKHKIK